jgi:hypothetical protein
MLIDMSRLITAEAKAADTLAAMRASMTISRMQGVLALGEARWATVLAYRDTAPWAEQVIIDSAGDWQRNSENIAFFAWLLVLTDAEVLFIAARAIVA